MHRLIYNAASFYLCSIIWSQRSQNSFNFKSEHPCKQKSESLLLWNLNTGDTSEMDVDTGQRVPWLWEFCSYFVKTIRIGQRYLDFDCRCNSSPGLQRSVSPFTEWKAESRYTSYCWGWVAVLTLDQFMLRSTSVWQRLLSADSEWRGKPCLCVVGGITPQTWNLVTCTRAIFNSLWPHTLVGEI